MNPSATLSPISSVALLCWISRKWRHWLSLTSPLRIQMLNTPLQAHSSISGWRHSRLRQIFVILSVLWCIASLKKTFEPVLPCWDLSIPSRLISPWRSFSMSRKKSSSCLSKKLYDSLKYVKSTSVPSSKRTMMENPSETLPLHC